MSDDLRQTFSSTSQYGTGISPIMTDNGGCGQQEPDTIQVEQVLGAEMAQTVIEFDMFVPDPKPDIKQVIDVYVKNVEVDNVDVITDSVIIRGDLDVKVMYVADLPDEPVHAYQRRHVRFTTDIEVDGAQPGMDADADVAVEYVDYDFHRHHDRRKVHVAIVVKCWTRVTATTELDMSSLGAVSGLDLAPYNNTNTSENVYSSSDFGGGSTSASAGQTDAGVFGEQNMPPGPGSVSVAGPGITPTAGTMMGASGTATISGSSVNIRTGPGTNFPIVTKVNNGATVTINEQAFGWYKVVLADGATTGWVASWLVNGGTPKG
jgi:hypothetical protein